MDNYKPIYDAVFNPRHEGTPYECYGGHAGVIRGQVNHGILKDIPKKVYANGDYSEKFINWLVDFWIDMDSLNRIFTLPAWLQKLVMLKIQELNPEYDFSATLKNL